MPSEPKHKDALDHNSRDAELRKRDRVGKVACYEQRALDFHVSHSQRKLLVPQ